MSQATLTAGVDEKDKISSDRFYSEENLAYVEKSVRELCEGKGHAHDLIEAEDE